ncbi:MAG: ABC transporter substrate-binding protein [Candidatus Thorarchaeota archaeon]|nr:ABC transporter substrate-binding protein [Candidatus Thorarchaeota archaeon]
MRKTAIIILSLFLVTFVSSNIGALQTVSAAGTSSDSSGPYIDKLVFKVIREDADQVLALQNNNIDIIGQFVDPSFVDQLSNSSNIEIATTLRNGYGYLIINCQKYPLNITAFRRAFAFALDKENISKEVWDDTAIPLDSVVPQINPFSAEGQLSYSYYDKNVNLGKQILTDAGFIDIDSDGYREAPDGSDFTVRIECAQSSSIALQVGTRAADALQALGIDATSVPTDFYDYYSRLQTHGDYDVAFMGKSFTDFDVDWLGFEYWSEYATEPDRNYPNFRNASYDSWRDKLLYSTDYNDVYEAAIEMQKILAYESPIIVCYENKMVSAYRTDTFEGHVNDIAHGLASWWTNQKVRRHSQAGGPFGGTFRWGNRLDLESFNFMIRTSESTKNVLSELYEPLLRRGPDGSIINWLCNSYITETHADNHAIPVGHSRYTFSIVRNASWTDGVPLTAQDIAFTYNYYRNAPDNPYSSSLQDAFALYAPQDYILVVEFNTESYWHLTKLVDLPVIPKHYFQNLEPSRWNQWNPNPMVKPMITSGPFYITDYTVDSFTELTRNPYYFRSVPNNDDIQSSQAALNHMSATITHDQSLPEIVQEQSEALWSNWSRPDFRPDIDPLLEKWLSGGTVDDSISLVHGNPSVLVYCAPWIDMDAIEEFADLSWKMDFKVFKLAKVSMPSQDSLKSIMNLRGVTAIRADKMINPVVDEFANPDTKDVQVPPFSLDMSEIRTVVGATESIAAEYTGDGIVVGHIDTGCDFGVPDLTEAYDNGTYDPSGYGLNLFVHANTTNVADPDAWLSDGNVLTYRNATGVYLNVSSWDPMLNYEGSGRYLIGDGDKNSPYHRRIGFVWLYAYYWGVDVGTMPDDIWQDIRLPDTSEVLGDYRVGFIFQQRSTPYMRAFAPALVYKSSKTSEWNLAIDWEGAEAWSWFWDGGIYYKNVNLTNPAETQPILDLCDWDFTDDIAVATYNYSNPVVAADLNGDGVNDYSLGAISWCFDANEWFTDEPVFNGFRSDGAAVCLYFDADTHGTSTAAHVASRGKHQYYDSNNGSYFYMTGIANQSKILSVRALTSGSKIGAYLWICGFDYNEATSTFNYTGNHQADLVTNSWGWEVASNGELSYLSLIWTILSTPGYLDPAYPGVLHIFSVGNEGSGFMTDGPPGCSAGVLTVGASTSNQYLEYLYGPDQNIEGIASFSSRGPSFLGYVKPDVVAPGLAAYAPVPVYASYLGQHWGSSYSNVTLFSGTSQSAPVVAGVAALVIEALNDKGLSWSPDKVKTIIQSTSERLGYDPATEGFGRVDAQAACEYVKNDVGFIVESSDSFDNLMGIANKAWSHSGSGPSDMLHTDVAHSSLPSGFGEGSLYFGQVFPGSVTNVTQKIFTNVSGPYITDTTGWTTSAYYWHKAETYSFSGTTFTYNDTVSSAQMYGWYDLRDKIGATTYDSAVSTYSYVTIGISFNKDDISKYGAPWSFLYDWSDDDPSDGMPNRWDASTQQGNELIRLADGRNSSCTSMMSFATNMSSLSAILKGDLTLVIHDPAFDDDMSNSGHSFQCTVIFWEKKSTSMITALPGSGSSTYTWKLTAPVDDTGIYQGYAEISDGTTTVTVPWSFSLVGNLSADMTEENTIVSGTGTDLSPYDSPVYGLMGKDLVGDYRSYAIYNPHSETENMGVRVIWEDAGCAMTVQVFNENCTQLTGDASSTNCTTAVMVELPTNPIGMYYLLIHPTDMDKQLSLPLNYTIKVMTYGAIAEPTMEQTYYSNWNTTPAPFETNDVLNGDHIIVNVTISEISVPNFPEKKIDHTSLGFQTGMYFEKTGDLVIPSSSYNPFTGTIDQTQFAWVLVNGIQKDDPVKLSLDFTSDDCDVMAWWADTVSDTWTYANNILGSKMATSRRPESCTITADRSGSIYFGIYNYAAQSGTFTLHVDTRKSMVVEFAGRSAWYDTTNFGQNATRDIIATATTKGGSTYVRTWNNVTFNNFFAPTVTLNTPNGGEDWTGSQTIDWTVVSKNADCSPNHEVYISNDGGTTFMLVASNLSIDEFTWDTTSWQHRDTYVVKVTTTDRGMYAEDISDAVFTAGDSIPDQPPLIWGLTNLACTDPTGKTITWVAGSLYPSLLELWVNNVRESQFSWTTQSNTTTVSLNGLTKGAYNYTFYAEDSFGHSTSFTTWVLVNVSLPPIIDHPLDITYQIGTTGHQIVWNPSDSNPSNYTLYRNGVAINSGTWNGEPIVVNVDGLNVGVYNYTLIIWDLNGNYAKDTVFVTVVPESTTNTTTTIPTNTIPTGFLSNEIILVLIGGMAAVVVVVVVIVKLRQRK